MNAIGSVTVRKTSYPSGSRDVVASQAGRQQQLPDGRAQRRTVRIGQQNGLVAQVLEGVSEGEIVVVHPSDAVEDGVRVRRR